MKDHEYDSERLRRRVAAIAGTDLAKELGRYRRHINKLSEIKARGAKYEQKLHPRTGWALTGNRAYRAYDEAPLCHKWLDERGVKPYHFFA